MGWLHSKEIIMSTLINKNTKFVALLLAVAIAPSAASAQNGAYWVDDRGRMMSLQFAGGSGPLPSPVDREPAAMTEMFKQICVDNAGVPEKVEGIRESMNLEYNQQTLGAGKKKPPAILNIWHSDGLVISQTDGFFAAPTKQCNASFYMSTLPTNDDMVAALSEPTNAGNAFKKNGKPNKKYSPEWVLADGNGKRAIVRSYISKASQYMLGNRVQLTATWKDKKSK